MPTTVWIALALPGYLFPAGYLVVEAVRGVRRWRAARHNRPLSPESMNGGRPFMPGGTRGSQ